MARSEQSHNLYRIVNNLVYSTGPYAGVGGGGGGGGGGKRSTRPLE